MKIAIVIPCFNEKASITDFVQSLVALREQTGYDITPVVVNDCSTDDTGLIIRSLPCVAIDLPVNLGIGGAVQTGFRYAWQHGYDIGVQMDGDGQHPAAELPKLIEAMVKAEADIAIGSRFIQREGFQSTALRRFGIRYFSVLVRWITGQTITDPTSGFRALNRQAMAIVDRYYPVEYPEPEILIHFLYRKLKVVEAPVEMQARQGGVSSIHSWKSAYYMLKVTAGIIFSQIRLILYDKH